jgi:hypothetical protein
VSVSTSFTLHSSWSVCDEHILGISLRVIADEITKFCMYYLNYAVLLYLYEDVERRVLMLFLY